MSSSSSSSSLPLSQNSSDRPDARTLLDAVKTAISAATGVVKELKTAATGYVDTLCHVDGTVQPSLPFSEVLHYNQLERGVKLILKSKGEPDHFIRRFKRPTGSKEARVGNLLFYPPSRNPDHIRDTLVQGPDTTTRMLAAHLSDVGLYTMDMYPFSTKIPKRAAQYKEFTWDTSFQHPETALALWEHFLADAQTIYAQRAILPGLEVVWGSPVRKCYKAATRQLQAGWQWLSFDTSIDLPGVENEIASFEAGPFSIKVQLCYRLVLGQPQFGKLVIFHCHPCKTAVFTGNGAASTDALINLLYVASRGKEPPSVDEESLFAEKAKPCLASSHIRELNISLPERRAAEIAQKKNFTRADLDAHDPAIMRFIDKTYKIDETLPESILFQALSANSIKRVATMGPEGLSRASKKGRATMGPEAVRQVLVDITENLGEEGRKARKAKAMETLGVEGRKAIRRKQDETLGPEGRKERKRKQLETMGEAGMDALSLVLRDFKNKDKPSRVARLARDDVHLLAFNKLVKVTHEERKAEAMAADRHPPNRGSIVNSLIRAKIAALFDGSSLDRSLDSSYEGWPAGLPHSVKAFNTDEAEYIGSRLYAGIIKIASNASG